MSRLPLGLLTALLLVAAGIAAGAASGASRIVPCDETIGVSDFPGPDTTVVAGAVALPREPLLSVNRSNEPGWPYVRKLGLVVAGRARVEVSVPPGERAKVAITWGSRPDAYASIVIEGCRSLRGVGRVDAGGVRLRRSSACVPVRFRVGRLSATVRLGIGRAC
ncbi:MAG: hypothetical protein FJW96_02580 [Actinobacteria bacterium]|nr:hypothetical protein [Actinomycetota bacterium]